MNVGSLAASDPAASVSHFQPSSVDAGIVRPSRRTGSTARDVSRQPGTRVGIIFNKLAHRNVASDTVSLAPTAGMDWAAPRSIDELNEVLARFAAENIGTLVIDGGDGTIRDVLSAAARHFTGGMPQVAIIPSGKTNALAIDLGVPQDLGLQSVLQMIAAGKTRRRAPVEVVRADGSGRSLRGFMFGAGGFVRATAFAQTTHKMGAFRSLAVGLAVAAAVVQTIFAGRDNPWRRGDAVRLELDDGRRVDRPVYLLLASTLERLPLGLKPFGRVRAGLKLLGIDAPPRHMLAAAPALLAGSEGAWLDRAGYHRDDIQTMRIALDSEFILDGERYPGGELIVRQGRPIDFIVP